MKNEKVQDLLRVAAFIGWTLMWALLVMPVAIKTVTG